uniref:Uncharacterized protein n=1 Tax=Meloidogyne incognita TaxID=6306 RepID=A0A914LLA7_MELIC
MLNNFSNISNYIERNLPSTSYNFSSSNCFPWANASRAYFLGEAEAFEGAALQNYTRRVPITLDRPVAFTEKSVRLSISIRKKLTVFLKFSILIHRRNNTTWLGTAKNWCSICENFKAVGNP